MFPRPRYTACILASVLPLACSQRAQVSVDAAAERQGTVDEALVPDRGGSLAPAGVRLEGDGAVDGSHLADLEACAACHAAAFAQQQASAHAFASFNNPIYRAAVDRLRSERGHDPSRMCAGCHDAALLVDGAMGREVRPEDERAHNGVSCRLCHGIAKARRGGNGSYTLEKRKLPLPVQGDPQSLRRHKRAARPPPAAELCGACHESFLHEATGNPWFLEGQAELVGWAESAYAGQGAGRVDFGVQRKDCVGCHMPLKATRHEDPASRDGRLHSHRFPGGHTWLAAMRGDEEQLQSVRDMLTGVVTLDIPMVWVDEERFGPSEAVPVEPGVELALDLVVRNIGVGHRFPAGVRDAQFVWIEVEVLDASGRVVLHSSREPDDLHVLRSLVADREGNLLFSRQTHEFAAPIADHTLAARGAAVIRYRGTLPTGTEPPLRLRARLLHKSRNPQVGAAACRASRIERGRRFAGFGFGEEKGPAPLEPCRDQPVTLLASYERKSDQAPASKSAQRLYEHGLALLHTVQERLHEAKASLLHALDELEEGGDPELRAAVLAALAEVAGRTGRLEDALGLLDVAEALVPDTAAVARIRGGALARVWRWQRAARAFSEATGRAPGNGALWRQLALARGSAGDDRGALQAAQRGLELRPRDPDLLRVQALSLHALGAEPDLTRQALNAYLTHRTPDRAQAIRRACMKKSSLCAREGIPVHEHRLVR